VAGLMPTWLVNRATEFTHIRPLLYSMERAEKYKFVKTNIATCNKCIEILLTHSKFHLNRSHYIILNRRQLELEPL